MSGQSKTRQPSSYYIEWGYIKARGFTLTFLALGTMLVFYRIGTYLGETTFNGSLKAVFILRVLCVGIAYYSVDWVLKIVLTDASTVAKPSANVIDISGNKIKSGDKDSRHVWKVAIAALLITTSISLVSTFFVSDDLSGKSHLLTYQNQLLSRIALDTALKQQALSIISGAGDKQTSMQAHALQEYKRLVGVAVDATKNKSWKNDYYLYKDRPKTWFWTCKKCPSGYKAYRNTIKAAMEQGNALINAANGYSHTITATLSPTLSYSATQDSALIELKNITATLEKRRQSKQTTLNIVLFSMTLAGAFMSLLVTWLLKKHREHYGQLIPDNPIRFMLITTDIMNRVRKVLSDILYSITFYQHERMVKHGFVKTYTLEDTHITDDLHATVHIEKRCVYCEKKLINKRSDAKYCDDQCRMNYHTAKRAKA